VITTPILYQLLSKSVPFQTFYNKIILSNATALSYLTNIDKKCFEYLIDNLNKIVHAFDVKLLVSNNSCFFKEEVNSCVAVLTHKLKDLQQGTLAHHTVLKLIKYINKNKDFCLVQVLDTKE
jgi:hypothetical protein